MRTALEWTGDAEEEGYEDEYQLEAFEISVQDYIKRQPVQNFRSAWEELDESTEMTDDYGLGQRDSLQVNFLLPSPMAYLEHKSIARPYRIDYCN